MLGEETEEDAGRLHHAHSHNLRYAEDKEAFFTERKAEYSTLVSTLQTLSVEVKQEIMVPFGKHAFIPGNLRHTGEVMVFLGDGYFVNRTTSQAVGIAKRRIEAIDADIARCKVSVSDTQSRMKLASELDREGNIREELSEEDKLRVRGKARVPGKGVPVSRPAFSQEELRQMLEGGEEEEGEEEVCSSGEEQEVEEITFTHSKIVPSASTDMTPASVVDNIFKSIPKQKKRVSFENKHLDVSPQQPPIPQLLQEISRAFADKPLQDPMPLSDYIIKDKPFLDPVSNHISETVNPQLIEELPKKTPQLKHLSKFKAARAKKS